MRPTFEIEIDGQAPSEELARRLLRLRVSEETGERSGSLELKLSNHGPAIEPPPTGVEALVRLGFEGAPLHPAGVYIIEGVDLAGPPDTVTIHGTATNFATSDTAGGIKQSMRSQKTRSWGQTTLGDIVRTIAGDQGLSPVVGGDLDGLAIQHLDQVDQSDMDLLTELGRRFDAVAKTMAGKLVFIPRGQGTKADGSSLPLVEIPVEEIKGWKMRKTGKNEYGTVVAHWNDTEAGERKEVRAGEGEPVKTLRHPFPTEAEAQRAAEGELAKQRRQAQEMSLNLPGRPDLFVEQPLQLAGGPPGTEGEWIVSKAEHTLEGQGLKTSLSAGPKVVG